MYQQRACPARCWRLEHIAGPPQQRFFLGSTSNKIGLVMLDPSDGAAWCLAVLKWPHLIKEQARGSNCILETDQVPLPMPPKNFTCVAGSTPRPAFRFMQCGARTRDSQLVQGAGASPGMAFPGTCRWQSTICASCTYLTRNPLSPQWGSNPQRPELAKRTAAVPQAQRTFRFAAPSGGPLSKHQQGPGVDASFLVCHLGC